MQENNSAATIEQVFQKDAFTLSVGVSPTENLSFLERLLNSYVCEPGHCVLPNEILYHTKNLATQITMNF
jgi:hypothetical protein